MFYAFVSKYSDPAHLKSNCPETHFTCNNMKCLRGSLVCDGDNDCGDGSDEIKGCTLG